VDAVRLEVDGLIAQSIHHHHYVGLSKIIALSQQRVASALLGFDAPSLYADREALGQLLGTFVCQELRRLASGSEYDIRFHHFRDRDQSEVDIVLQRDGRRVAGVEVKASATISDRDFRGLRKFAAAAGPTLA